MPTPFTWIRRGSATALVVWGGWMLQWGKVAAVCGEKVAESRVVEVCEPIALTDPRLAWVTLAVLLLLMPDLSELELAGVLSLKRAVENAKGETEQLRSEVQQLVRVTTSQQNQQLQRVNVIVGPELAEAVAEFRDDVDRGDTGPLTTFEEIGAHAYLAFAAAMRGLLSESFGEDAEHASIVGWVRAADGSLSATYLIGSVPTEDLLADVRDDLTAATLHDTVVTRVEDGRVAFTAYAWDDSPPGTKRRVMGAVSAVFDASRDWSAAPTTVAALLEGTAGAYGLLLQRILGEPSTLDSLSPKEQQ